MINQNQQSENTALLILGMHRSGTSCLAGSLQAGGLDLGDISTWSEHNRKGNREHRDFVNLNERILISNGGSWENPPDTIQWNDRQHSRALALIAPFQNAALWGFKDPRTVLLLEGWQAHLKEVQCIGIYRKPSAVAQSLYQRNQMPQEQGYRLWNHYNRALIEAYNKNPFPILCFDWTEDEFHCKLNQVHRLLGLNALSRDEMFFSAELINQAQGPEDRKPLETDEIYHTLKKISYQNG